MSLEIYTNRHTRPVLYWWDLSDSERADFDYLDSELSQDSATFFRYRGAVYDLGEFSRIARRASAGRGDLRHLVDDDSPLLAWDGILTDSYFSAVVVRYTDGFESVIVGRVLS